MRSRFSAFALGDYAYLFRTLHADHEDHARGHAAFAESAAKSGRQTRYDALRVLDRDGPDVDGVARVLFHAAVKRSGKDASFLELSSFVHDGEGWRYVGGELRSGAPRVDERIASFLGRSVKE